MFSSRTDWSLTPNRLSKELQEYRSKALPLLDLTESNPTRCGLAPKSEEILGALANPRSLTYDPDPHGLLPARLAVADYYRKQGVEIDANQIFLTTSTSEAYSFAFRLLANPGDNVLIPRPSYPLLDFLARLNDLELIPYRLLYDGGWQIDLASVQRGVNRRTRAVVVVQPNNPTGSFVRPEELRFLIELAKAHDLALISDEVFLDYAFEPAEAIQRGKTHAGNSEALCFTLSGLSKISALPQMKLAWLAVSGPAVHFTTVLARLEIIADTYLSVSAPLGYALPSLLELRHHVKPKVLERVQSNLRWLEGRLSSDSPVSRLKVEGGWYVILRLPSTRTDEEWAIALLNQHGVLVHPGHFYDFTSEGYLVVSLLTTPEVFRQGISKLLALVGRA